jgi:hypothetical protein
MPYKDPEKNLASGKARAREWAKSNPERAAFKSQRSSAAKRGIQFLLTFDEWWIIWNASGKWEQRGRLKGQYVMARFGDSGPYVATNVRICTKEENYAEYISTLSEEQLQAIGQISLGKSRTPEQRQRCSEAIRNMWARMPPLEKQARAIRSRIARYGK